MSIDKVIEGPPAKRVQHKRLTKEMRNLECGRGVIVNQHELYSFVQFARRMKWGVVQDKINQGTWRVWRV